MRAVTTLERPELEKSQDVRSPQGRGTALITLRTVDGFVSFSGLEMSGLLSAELFRVATGAGVVGPQQHGDMPSHCHERWTAFSTTLAALPEGLEVFLMIGGRGAAAPAGAPVMFMAVGRGETADLSAARCSESAHTLAVLLTAAVDFAEFDAVMDVGRLEAVATLLEPLHAVEIRRRYERVVLSHGLSARATVGFTATPACEAAAIAGAVGVLHLFPWRPSRDGWSRLMEALDRESAALIVHAKGLRRAPAACVDSLRREMSVAEMATARMVGGHMETLLTAQADALRHEMVRRLSYAYAPLIAARVFIVSDSSASESLVATAVSCLDGAPDVPGRNGHAPVFAGGASICRRLGAEVLGALDNPPLDVLFSPSEAGNVLRTPMPTDGRLPGVNVLRARTAPLLGESGGDVLFGDNVHQNRRVRVALDEEMRFRHVYALGQTGTGKSTFLLNCILHDIRRGRGVAVIDPHGTLIEQILALYPNWRSDDLVVVDVTDAERPVGFNVLRITETDDFQYRLARDIVIDDLHSYLERTYDLQVLGPVFETHYRGMMSLLMGLDSQREPFIPNLLLFRSLYTNDGLRGRLAERLKGRDLMIDDFIREVGGATGELSLRNTATYVTSKFSRFVSDLALRNITCQNSTLDFDDIVNSGRVLLFYLGKGRFGDHAAGLLASQVISRVRHAVMKRGTGGGVRPFYLYADEFQLFADDKFAELMAEARKFRLSLTLAHQYAQQLSPKVLQGVLGNVGTTVAFRVGAPDAEMLGQIFAPTMSARELTSLPNFRAYVRSHGRLGHTPFSLEALPPPTGGNEEHASELRRRVRLRFGRDRRVVEEEIRRTYEAYTSL